MTERTALHDVLDAGIVCHLAYVAEDGTPRIVPTGYGHEGDTLYVHGSTGAASLRGGAGAEVCVNVTLLDGVIYSRAVFHHSVNYRSATIHGTATPVTDPDAKLHALHVITEHIAPGSWDHARGPSPQEFAKTAVLALDLTEAAVKIRTGGPGEEPEDLTPDRVGASWAGVLPLVRAWGTPQPCRHLPEDVGVPDYVSLRGPQHGPQ
ncbi:hypothetical protein CLV71_125154 [Actinophytocola oryzae]|uniref:Nitroimidazol reductase NimA-like FMN-containing flavoprotein (Pyridoxamine 5'-phosphate oxidase superfamily) n=1 Tax=Actinophytocola oryzae TaxID=502181 RepID=A0A4R7UV83_9PSEU|nr:hypothetical protein CLV71_125154 [Actinophytocola oryzae]